MLLAFPIGLSQVVNQTIRQNGQALQSVPCQGELRVAILARIRIDVVVDTLVDRAVQSLIAFAVEQIVVLLALQAKRLVSLRVVLQTMLNYFVFFASGFECQMEPLLTLLARQFIEIEAAVGNFLFGERNALVLLTQKEVLRTFKTFSEIPIFHAVGLLKVFHADVRVLEHLHLLDLPAHQALQIEHLIHVVVLEVEQLLEVEVLIIGIICNALFALEVGEGNAVRNNRNRHMDAHIVVTQYVVVETPHALVFRIVVNASLQLVLNLNAFSILNVEFRKANHAGVHRRIVETVGDGQ